jgi:hypothetical protein
VRRVFPLLLVACFLGLGSGLLRFAHENHHAHEDALADAAAQCVPADHGGDDHQHPRRHDESTCDLHALLNAPLTVAPVVTLLVHLGLFVAFLTLLTTPLARLRLPARIDCRGPPPCWP